MATPVVNDVALPNDRILVLPDEGNQPSTGVIFRRPVSGGNFWMDNGNLETRYNRVLFVREMAAEVLIDDTEYLAMHTDAVVGLIPS